MNAAQVVQGDPYLWGKQHAMMDAKQLYAFGDELAAMIKHPAMSQAMAWQQVAGARMAAIMAEHQRRWDAVWKPNRELSDHLEKIESLF